MDELIRLVQAWIDRKESDGCNRCEYEHVKEWELPCRECKRSHKDYWQYRIDNDS